MLLVSYFRVVNVSTVVIASTESDSDVSHNKFPAGTLIRYLSSSVFRLSPNSKSVPKAVEMCFRATLSGLYSFLKTEKTILAMVLGERDSNW